jgi:hypothetical protein
VVPAFYTEVPIPLKRNTQEMGIEGQGLKEGICAVDAARELYRHGRVALNQAQ